MNDPNGLCFFKGEYHVFYQYSKEPQGGNKYWGHFKSRDLIHWQEAPIFLSPDKEYNKDGVYSGSALVQGEKLHLFYTGNVKEPGDYDYIYTGRQHNTVHVVSPDGERVASEEVLLYNKDYPEGLSCHVRDPKVFAYEGKYYMVLGARTKEDRGQVLLYASEDLEHWTHIRTFETLANFGYMWECPDLFEINGQWILMASPQGLPSSKYEFQNVYSCGYFLMQGDFRKDGYLTEYIEADFGFDFYAPQTFLQGERRLLLGWMGMPDADYKNPTAALGWQHCMSCFRELDFQKGRLIMKPAGEIASRITSRIPLGEDTGLQSIQVEEKTLDMVCRPLEENLQVRIFDTVQITYEKAKGEVVLGFLQGGYGRTERYCKCRELETIEIVTDASSVEIFINGGEKVMSTRMYPEHTEKIEIKGLVKGEIGVLSF